MFRLALILARFAFTILVLGCGQNSPPVEKRIPAVALVPEITLQSVKMAEFEKALADRKGSIVVVDIWADFCVPCKEEFPRLVSLHEKHARDGVACMSLSVDDPEAKEAALRFLVKQHARFANFHILEDAQVWQEKWDLKSVPAVLVFDRQGKLARKFSHDSPGAQFTYADVEKLVVSMLTK